MGDKHCISNYIKPNSIDELLRKLNEEERDKLNEEERDIFTSCVCYRIVLELIL